MAAAVLSAAMRVAVAVWCGCQCHPPCSCFAFQRLAPFLSEPELAGSSWLEGDESFLLCPSFRPRCPHSSSGHVDAVCVAARRAWRPGRLQVGGCQGRQVPRELPRAQPHGKRKGSGFGRRRKRGTTKAGTVCVHVCVCVCVCMCVCVCVCVSVKERKSEKESEEMKGEQTVRCVCRLSPTVLHRAPHYRSDYRCAAVDGAAYAESQRRRETESERMENSRRSSSSSLFSLSLSLLAVLPDSAR